MEKHKLALAALYLLGRATQGFAQGSVGTSSSAQTALPSPTGGLGDLLPLQVALPPKQAWCPSDIFCAGELLQTVNLAHVYPDDKTFIDKPTSKPPQEVLNDFRNISTNTTYGDVVQFLQEDFTGEGQELQSLALQNFNSDPSFLDNLTNPVVRGFSQAVHSFWTQLIRGTNSSTLCGSTGRCESTLIPLNHTFVVPGGRFREQYYWDSFWIMEGLLVSGLNDIANATLQNFMDELDTIGFIPNGGRIYYLNRSQPPMFIQMLARYVETSGDDAILQRALPLAEKELRWWDSQRSVNVTSPFTNTTHKVYRYAVTNSAPRPESYLTDYRTANDPDLPALNETQRSALYAELASGAESGWDYTVRWYGANGTSLRDLKVRSTIAVDLNSIIYRSHVELAKLYGSANTGAADRHRNAAGALKDAVLDLLWDSQKLAFYDFNTDANSRNSLFSAANFYPYWSGIIPNEVLASGDAAFKAFSSLNLVLNRYNGTFPSTFIDSHLQWDAPNTWPPHQHIILEALRALPSNVSTGPVPKAADNQSTFSLIPVGQLGVNEEELPGQPFTASQNASTTGPEADINTLDGTVRNGGDATEGEGWAAALGRQLANRYFASTLCSWRATGGSLGDVLPRLSDAELSITHSLDQSGHMFEKFSNLDIDSAGRGGEYVVQAGFGWTNGVLLWVAEKYGNALVTPECPSLVEPRPGLSGDDESGSGEEDSAEGAVPNPVHSGILSVLATAVAVLLFSIL